MFMIIFMLLCVTLLRSYVMLFPLLEHILSMLCAHLAQALCTGTRHFALRDREKEREKERGRLHS